MTVGHYPMQIPQGMDVAGSWRTLIAVTVAVTLISCDQSETPPQDQAGSGEIAVDRVEESPARPAGDWIAGTVVATPEYDESAGGWDTERVAAKAGSQLKTLAHVLDSTNASDDEWESVGEWLADRFSGQALVPDAGVREVAYTSGAIKVTRLANPEVNLTRLNKEAFLEDLKGLSDRSKTQFKVVRIAGSGESGNDWETEVVVHFTTFAEERSEQVNARWQCRWQSAGETLTLQEISVKELEVVSFGDGKEGAGTFTDCTKPVFQGVGSFGAQMIYSADHWLGLIDSRHGMDVGGWQGIAVADVNGDGLEDIYVSQPGGLPNRLYLQKPDGTLKDVSKNSGTDWIEPAHGSLFADLDNDGDQDLLVGTPDGVVSMANDGKGVFKVISTEIIPGGMPYSLAAADYDVDGDVDVFVCCYNTRFRDGKHHVFVRPIPYHDANNGGKNALLRNDGRGRFQHATLRTGLDENNLRFSYAASWEDFDNDGDLDLYVANDFGTNNLYRNETEPGGIVKFRDVAEELGAEDIGPGMSVSWGDWDNDGFSDLYVSNMFSSAGNRIAYQSRFLSDADDETRAKFQRHARGNTLLSNKKGSGFEDVSVDSGVNVGRWAWGSLFADFNNDGWQDIVVANGFITQEDSGDL